MNVVLPRLIHPLETPNFIEAYPRATLFVVGFTRGNLVVGVSSCVALSIVH